MYVIQYSCNIHVIQFWIAFYSYGPTKSMEKVPLNIIWILNTANLYLWLWSSALNSALTYLTT